MEKFVQRENVLVEYQQPGGDDMDFNDVFGGPPRRYSMQEVSVRYSFGSGESDGDDLRVCSSPWGKEKPVFGEEVTPRRRHQGQGDDFFGDIFRSGDESFSSPRRGDRNSVFGTSPAGSRSMSPARGSVSRGEPYGTSLPAQFSLPAKLTKSMEIPTFAPNNHGQQRMDGSVKGINSSHSSNLLSRFSSRVIRGQDEVRVRQSPLSHHASLSNEDSPSAVRSHHKENAGNLKNDAGNADNLDNQFHFSIYKWAGQGVPMMMPLVGKKTLQPKDTRTNDGRIKSDNLETDAWKMESKKDLRSKEGTKEAENYFEGLLCETSIVPTSRNDSVVPSGDTQNIKEEVTSVGEIEQKPRKSTTKPLHVFLSGAVKQPGKVTEVKRNKNRSPKGVLFNKHVKKNVMNDEETGFDGSSSATIGKSGLSGAAINSGIARGKSVVKGKVKDFVQIFNQEAESVPKADVQTRSRGFRWKATSVNQKENEVNLNAGKVEEKVNLQNANKNPDVSPKADENKDKDEAQHSHIMNPSPTSYNISANQANAFSSESLHKDSVTQVENSDEPLEENFQVQELSDDHEKVTEEEGSEDMKALDTKIQQWSFGKKGNIRSLLSTLQYVLWPGSGWKPVPLVDLIEANSVKRAYQKALLRLHPDKLQQKGAPFHHKYMAEKVFDILQEAWDHFNTLAPL